MQNDFTQGNMLNVLMRFSVPYLISCFLQTFYGMADLFITGQFYDDAVITAVSNGSQIMHMLTVIIVGLAMGSTIFISRSIGSGKRGQIGRGIGNSVTFFIGVAAGFTFVCILAVNAIISILRVPEVSVLQTKYYLLICFAGIPFIIAYNVISSIFRGLGDTKSPMYFIFVAGVINIILDIWLIGPMKMAAAGAALATVISQTASVFLAFFWLRKKLGAGDGAGKTEAAQAEKMSGSKMWTKRRAKAGKMFIADDENISEKASDRVSDPDSFYNVTVTLKDLRPDRDIISKITSVGVPIAFQDGLIQVSFIVISIIANSRGAQIAAAVGIVEKIISFLFLVPSAMLSTVSVAAAQNAGAGKPERSKLALRYAIMICISFGAAVFIICQFIAPGLVGLFAKKSAQVAVYGGQYLRTYSLDCMMAGIHFCFSGFFSAYNKSIFSFIHNMISVILVRVPGAYLASVFFTTNLMPMGLAAPMGSLLSAIICYILYKVYKKDWE